MGYYYTFFDGQGSQVYNSTTEPQGTEQGDASVVIVLHKYSLFTTQVFSGILWSKSHTPLEQTSFLTKYEKTLIQ